MRITKIFILVSVVLLFVGCANIFEKRHIEATESFNKYQRWFDSLDKTAKNVDVTLTVRVRCYGTKEQKQKDWYTYWQAKNPQWGMVGAGVAIASNPPEIWCDLRQDGRGELIMPMHVLGHELGHLMRIKDVRVINMDSLTDKDIYFNTVPPIK